MELNERWAKGHVRLASAYIAIGGHSNDACNALQRSLSLDPGNSVARQMLMRELRRDHERGQGEAASGSGRSEPSAPPYERRQPTASGGVATAPASPNDYMGSPTSNRNGASGHHPVGGYDDASVDDSPSLAVRAQFHLARAWAWWDHELSDDMKTLLKVALGLLVLYVAFGGRFGLDTALGRGGEENRGNYQNGNAYDRYYGGPSRASSSDGAYTSSGHNDRLAGRYSRGDGNPDGRRDLSSEYTYAPRQSRQGSSSSSYHFPNLLDGSLPSMLILGALFYACHRLGINPFHAIWALNAVAGNRGHGRGHGMRGLGIMGLGYGMARNNMGWGQRRGG